ncbi:MAG: hypothetical protein ACOCQY_02755 [Halorhabdus sp.]
MSVAIFIMVMVVASVAVISVGAILVFGFKIIGPIQSTLSGPPEALGWGDPGTNAVTFAAIGGIGLMLVIIIWLIASPVHKDRRQQYR